jgi:hypothetical protein
MKQPRQKTGKFASPYQERQGNPISLRLPQSLDEAMRTAVSWQSAEDNHKLKKWIEDAIAQKLKHHSQSEKYSTSLVGD